MQGGNRPHQLPRPLASKLQPNNRLQTEKQLQKGVTSLWVLQISRQTFRDRIERESSRSNDAIKVLNAIASSSNGIIHVQHRPEITTMQASRRNEVAIRELRCKLHAAASILVAQLCNMMHSSHQSCVTCHPTLLSLHALIERTRGVFLSLGAANTNLDNQRSACG